MPSDGGFHTAEGSSRKRLKISRDSGRPPGNPSNSPEVVSLISSPNKSAIMPAPLPPIQQNGHTDADPCHHEQSLRSLHVDLDAMRGLITCKICDRFLYEPYSLTCGHTYCYSCLSSWMVDNHKKTCPDCRAIIKDQPTPSYVIREMVHIFRSKSELLPDGETSEEHDQLAKEEADIVGKDKSNTAGPKAGLFKGHFKKGGRAVPMLALHDSSDNVYRCPQCINEVEDGWCLHCHVRVATGEDEDESDDDTFSNDSLELDHDLEADDHDHEFGLLAGDVSDYSGYEDYIGEHPYLDGPGYVDPAFPVHLYSEDESEDDSEQDRDMEGFIVDDDTAVGDGQDSDDESDGTEREMPAPRQPRRQPPIVLSDDDDEEEHHDAEEEERPAPRRRRLIAAFRRPLARPLAATSSTRATTHVSDSEDDEDDEGPVPANSQRNRRPLATRARQRPVMIVSDDEDDDSEGHTETSTRSVTGGFSPLQSEDGHEDDGSSRARSVSVLSGLTESSMEEDDEDEDELEHDDEDNDGMDDESDDQNTTNDFGVHPYSHRLHMLGPRAARHAEPPAHSSRYRTLGQNAPSAFSTNRRPQLQQVQQSYPRFNSQFMPGIPPPAVYPHLHPFGLGNVLSRIQERNIQHANTTAGAAPIPPNPYVNASRRTGSNVSSQSSLGGGVDVRSSGGGSGRRRRFEEIEEEGEE